MFMGFRQLLGMVFVLLLIAGVGLYSGKKVKTAADFTTAGGKTGWLMVCGTIMGSLVGGHSTLGTAQLAFSYGISAWWFTIGSGSGCLILALLYTKRLRGSASTTLIQTVSAEYGPVAGTVASLLSSLGMLISVVAQMVAAVALVSAVMPLSAAAVAVLCVALMALYVIFGGVWGAGMGGIVKLTLLYFSAIAGSVLVLHAFGGLAPVSAQLTALLAGTPLGEIGGIRTPAGLSSHFFRLVARGFTKDIGSGLSLLLGVLSTQIYAQAVLSAKSDREGVKGALLPAFLIPPIGGASILIGLFMRTHYITSAELAALAAMGEAAPAGLTEIASTAQVYPVFVLNHMPPLLGGIVLGALLITIVGGGAGLSLGAATVLVNDLFGRFSKRLAAPENRLLVSRVTILFILGLAALISLSVPGAVINDIGFLSMGLRGAVVFLPLTCALFFPKRVDWRFIVAAELCAPLSIVAAELSGTASVDPLFIGIAVSLVFCLAGAIFCRLRPAGAA